MSDFEEKFGLSWLRKVQREAKSFSPYRRYDYDWPWYPKKRIDDFDRIEALLKSTSLPPCWTQTDDKSTYTYTVDMPGVKKADVDITLVDEAVKVQAKAANREYEFTVNMPDQADHSTLTATLEDGVLTLTVSALEVTHKQTKIKVL